MPQPERVIGIPLLIAWSIIYSKSTALFKEVTSFLVNTPLCYLKAVFVPLNSAVDVTPIPKAISLFEQFILWNPLAVTCSKGTQYMHVNITSPGDTSLAVFFAYFRESVFPGFSRQCCLLFFSVVTVSSI